MKQIGPAKYTYLEWDGVHEWNFWDRSLVYAIDRFINPGLLQKKLGDCSSGKGGITHGRTACTALTTAKLG